MLAEVTPYEAGRLTGQAFAWLLFVAGALKCWSISRRPTTNRKCALALMFALLAFLFASIAGGISKSIGPSPALALVMGFSALGMFGLIIAALVLAILGLVEYGEKPGAFVQGRTQAIWALVLAGIMGMLVVVGFVSGFMRTKAYTSQANTSGAGKVTTFDDLNFQFRIPERSWVELDAAKLNKESKLALMRRFPEVYFFVIAEKLGVRTDFNSEQLAEIGKANLRAAAQARVLSETPREVKGLNGILVQTEAQVGQYRLFYQHWYCVTNGYAYQLIGYGRAEDREKVTNELTQMLANFDLLDRNRVASSGGFLVNYTSPRNLFSVIVTNSFWHEYATVSKNFPSAEFGMSCGDSCMIVLPVPLANQSLNADALAAGLLGIINVAYPNENLLNRKIINDGNTTEVQYDFHQNVEGVTLRYRFKILQANGIGYLVSAWTQRRATDADAILNDALQRFKLERPGIGLLSAERKLTAREQKTQGLFFNQAALLHFQSGEYEQALALFRAAVATDNQEPLYIVNALQTWQHLDRPNEALEFLRTCSAAMVNKPAVRAQQAYFQGKLFLTDQAITNYAGIFTEGFRNDTQFTEYLNLLCLEKQYDQALAEAQKYLEAEDSAPIRLCEADIYALKKDYAKAIELLNVQREKAPFNAQITSRLADTYIQAQRYTEALDVSRELVKLNSASAFPYVLKGRSELGLKWYREAKESFEAAAKFAPADKEIRNYVDYLSGLLGQGSNLGIREPIAPISLAAISETNDTLAQKDYAKNYGAYYVRRVTAMECDTNNQTKTTEFMLVKVLDTSGVAAFSTVQMLFDPLNEQIFVNDVHVTDGSGKTISTGQVSDYYVLDEHSPYAASHKKVLNIPVSGLQPGCELSVMITRRDIGRAEEFPFVGHSFAGGFPVRESDFYFRGDLKNIKYRTSPQLEAKKVADGYLWRMNDPLVARWEPIQAPGATFLPMLWLTDASSQWPVLASNYLAAIKDRLVLGATLRQQTEDLVKNASDSKTKIELLARYVQTNCTYKAIEFGRRARIPNTPDEVLRNKYGDCKDHAVLLQQMLSAVGIPAYLALVNNRAPIEKDLPSFDQFDHMVVYIPQTGSFIDCTSKGADAAHALPLGIAGEEAFVLDPGNPRFVGVPAYSRDASIIDVEQNCRLVGKTDLAVEETMTLTGVHAAYLREFLLELPATSHRTALQNQMGMMNVELTEFSSESLDEPREPLRLRFAYTLKNRFRESNDRLVGTLGLGFVRSYLAASPVDKRLTPFEVLVPTSLRISSAIAVPKGFRVETAPAPTAPVDPRFLICRERVQAGEDSLKINYDFRQSSGQFRAADYAAYREAMAYATSMLDKEVVFRK